MTASELVAAEERAGFAARVGACRRRPRLATARRAGLRASVSVVEARPSGPSLNGWPFARGYSYTAGWILSQTAAAPPKTMQK